ncbi:hypothetical protein SRCM100730_02000 [Bacillus velezensis]|uniref:Uncharacterized protein n=1 Tax=Bacillus velezensis TaxID=492670 RepID=A0A7W4QHE1_BACVE|nr:hypothetical protein S100072_00254 [Bacillus velezensis]ASB63748.1 hypothetical protein S101413_00266 [Bacillus velezensis]ASS62419.1 hypothetical protein CHN56_01910 [Bacillus velezensis]ATC51609.1 hypothetical protein CLI97_02350 [Bacillus velezensis]OBR27049.1 hypothetical protein SRCM100731_03703 [Bacillus velezensis]
MQNVTKNFRFFILITINYLFIFPYFNLLYNYFKHDLRTIFSLWLIICFVSKTLTWSTGKRMKLRRRKKHIKD